MFLLLSNDDGYLSPGLRHLADALASEVARIAVIAPDRDCSGASHSLTLKRPLTVTEHGAGIWSVDGTPSDCVHLALTGYIDTPARHGHLRHQPRRQHGRRRPLLRHRRRRL